MEPNNESGEDKEVDNFIKPKTKRKKSQSTTVNNEVDSFEEFKEVFNEKTKTINYEEFCKFLLEVKHQDNPLAIAKKYTEDIPSLVNIRF